MKTLREYIDIVTENQTNPFDLLSNQDLLSISQSLNAEVREETSDRDQKIDEIISQLSPEQKKILQTKLNQEVKQRKQNPKKSTVTPPAKSSMLPQLIAGIIVGTAIALPYYGLGLDKDPSPPAKVVASVPKFKQVQVIDFDWRRIAKNFLQVDFKLKNTLSVAIKDIKVRCSGYAESGTRIDTNIRTIYKVLAPGKILSVNNFDMGFLHTQVETIGCNVEDFNTVNDIKEQKELETKADPITKIDRLFRD